MADPITVASTAFGFLTNVFGNDKDPERFAQTKRLKEAAINGSEAAYWQLKCLSGDTSTQVRTKAMQFGFIVASDGPCGYATERAKADAKIAVGQVDASRLTGTIAGTVAAGATGIGMGANPGTFTTAAGGAALATLSPWIWIAGGVALIFLLKRGK